MLRSLRPLMIALAVMALMAGENPQVRAGQPQARQTFSIRVPGKVNVETIERRDDGTPAAVRITATERVQVTVEHQPAVSSKPVPVLRSRLTLPGDSLTVPATEQPLDAKHGIRSTVIITVVPL